jgi:hypothetical protein
MGGKLMRFPNINGAKTSCVAEEINAAIKTLKLDSSEIKPLEGEKLREKNRSKIAAKKGLIYGG